MIIGGILSAINVIAIPINLLLLLLLDKRVLVLSNIITAVIKYGTKYTAYLSGTVDERPPITP